MYMFYKFAFISVLSINGEPSILIMNSEYFEMLSEKEKPLLVINNYKYNFHKVLLGNVKRWRCCNRKCKSYLKTDASNNAILEHSDEHNHEPISECELNRQKISNSLKRRAIEDICEKPMKLLHRELQKENNNILSVKDVYCIRQNIYNNRKKIMPNIPSNQQDVHDVLNSIQLITNEGELFLLRNDTVKNFVAFSTKTNLQFLSKLSTLYVDGTFRCCTKFFYQFFTIHGIVNEHYIPLAFFLLPNKSTDSYQMVFSCLKEECEAYNNNYNLSRIYVDFEKSIHIAAHTIFPTAEIKGCRFHLGQSWWRKIQNLGLVEEYSKDSDVALYLRYVFGLPFLNPAAVGDCFAIDFAEVLPTNPAVQKFADYLVDTYISEESEFPPEMWAENSSSIQRTTNACESFHAKFNSLFYTSNPNIYQFLDVLKNLQIDTYIKMRSANMPKKVYRRAAIKKKEFLDNKILLLRQNIITNFEFVKIVSIKYRPTLL